MEAVEGQKVGRRPAQVQQLAELKRGARDSFPMLVGFVPFGLVLGAQAARHGLNPAEVSLMTGLNFAGGSEFAAIALWASPPSVLLIIAITLLVNSRHLLMGAVLAPLLHHLPRRKALAALFVMCDESWAFGLADAKQRAQRQRTPVFSLPYYWGVAAPFYLTWVGCTAIGAAVGPILGDVEAYGFHMAFPAVFLVLMRGMWKGFRTARPWIVSLAVAAITHLLVPGAWYVLAGALSGVTAAYWIADRKEAKQ